ncbi:glycosyltransferase [Nitrospirillum sp. BR 11752]|uniref:glycosyltransferase family 2 protein n=1 Tax=Nitrospirillum sp. BR 11752 TaxID=3104293 RepID=UPI002EC2B460|nr:glycosyltransferase [Nitrospirillum sp. BR 11752]
MKPKVLHVITVYNGRSFVPRAIESAVSMDKTAASVDVLVLDDASPEAGWSEELKAFCDNVGALYYLAPRNLGIPRNVSLGLMVAVRGNYDFVTINNSDVIFPRNLITCMVEACRQDNVGSVTAWSNNVSIYSLPNVDPDRYLANADTVNFVSDALSRKYGGQVLDVPAGISFCIMMPVDVVRDVGVMDPIFGRGYCEETDWSLRSLKKGYRVTLSTGVFVYHRGRGSNLAAGLVSGAHTTVPENEDIIDLRYPDFRKNVEAFIRSGVMNDLKEKAVDIILEQAASKFGYEIVCGWKADGTASECGRLKASILNQNLSCQLVYSAFGFEQKWPLKSFGDLRHVVRRFGTEGLVSCEFDLTDSDYVGLGASTLDKLSHWDWYPPSAV